jgi:O-antigen chain-terminating methyltransferase
MNVIDIGCGRGEWLEILKENGITAKGIDNNRIAVSNCKECGLDATEADAVKFLKAIPESAFHAVTGFHIIEHLTFEQVISLMDEVHRVLKPGGVVVFETPNPANILVSAYDFYRDPSHKNPVHPDTIRFIAEFFGFQPAVIHLVEQKDDQCHLIDFDTWRLDVIQHYVDMPRDYVLIAHKKA